MQATAAQAGNCSPFGFYAPICKSLEDPTTGEWIVEGPLSDPGMDLQGEKMSQGAWGKSGLRKGLETLMNLGATVDWEHLYERTRDPAAIIGKGIELFDAPHPVTGTVVPWLRVRLLKGQALAQKAWTLLQSGGGLGFSVAGAALRKAGSTILETMITTVAITAVPVASQNAGTLRVAKALEAWAGDAVTHTLFVPELLATGVQGGIGVLKALEMSADGRGGPGIDAARVEDLRPAGRTRRKRADADEEDEDDEGDGVVPRSLVRKALATRSMLSARVAQDLAARLVA